MFNKTHLTRAIVGNTGTGIFITKKHTQQFYNIVIGVIFWYHLWEQVSKGNSRTEDKKMKLTETYSNIDFLELKNFPETWKRNVKE